MALTRKQFDVLECYFENGTLTQRQLCEFTGQSLGNVNKTVKELTELGYVGRKGITTEGIQALEPYRVKRAVFLAAGFSARLLPITLNTPKPLVRVKGRRIIDSLIDACLDAGIKDIYIVRGYLPEQFDQLLYKYPTVKFLENPLYNESNNISSAVVARCMLSNAYVFEADLLLANPSLIKRFQYSSNILGIKNERTDDWCVVVKDGVIVEEKVGGQGKDIWRLVGISYWSETDGQKLTNDLLEIYQAPGGRERYWEQVPLLYCKDKYAVEIRECTEQDVTEIDTFRELKIIDRTYDV
ncbi:MAG: winged helix-turn-helix transcriptional regulator [Lachnospiraceae bacterium]|nr:winged helix-turn-helix transcriptional regulator [Lachnospiraceae bacterium]